MVSTAVTNIEMVHMNNLVTLHVLQVILNLLNWVQIILREYISLLLDNKWYDLYLVVTIIGIDFVHSSKIFPKGQKGIPNTILSSLFLLSSTINYWHISKLATCLRRSICGSKSYLQRNIHSESQFAIFSSVFASFNKGNVLR